MDTVLNSCYNFVVAIDKKGTLFIHIDEVVVTYNLTNIINEKVWMDRCTHSERYK